MATNTEQPFVSISGCNKIIYIPSNVRVRYYSSLNEIPVDELRIPDYYIITSDGTPNGDVFGVYNYNGEVFVELKKIELTDEKVQITENTSFGQIGQNQKDFNKNVSDYKETVDIKNIEQDERLENLEGINYTWSPTNRTLTLFDSNGTQLSQVSLVSLDNEGTDFRYNASTLSLELWNADNELLDSIPVSSFVGAVGTQLQLNSNKLQLKDSQGNILSTVSFTVSNIQGLQAVLVGKQDVLTEDNLGQFMDLELTTKSTPTSGDTVLAMDSVTGKAVRIPTDQLGGGGSIDISGKLDKGTYTGTAQDLKNNIDNIQIGGRNFLRNSKNFAGLTNWNINGNPVITQNDDSITLNLPENTASVGMWQPLDLGGYIGDITISFDALSTNAGWNADLSIGIEGKTAKIGFGINDVTTWTRFSFTLNLSTATNSCVFIFYKGNNAYPLGIKLRNIKLEKGNKATDWTPAPEDKQDSLQNITGYIGVGKTDDSATEKLDVNGRTKSDGIIINETTSAILPKEIKFKDGKFKAALVDGVEKSVLLDGDVSGFDFNSLIDIFQYSNFQFIRPSFNTTSYFQYNQDGGNIFQAGQVAYYDSNPYQRHGIQYKSATTTLGRCHGNFRGYIEKHSYSSFNTSVQFAITSNIATQRVFVGYSDIWRQPNINPFNVAMNTLVDVIGVCMESGSSNLFIIYNDASGVANLIDTGFTHSTSYLYILRISKKVNSTIINVVLERVLMSTGVKSTFSYDITNNYTTYGGYLVMYCIDKLGVSETSIVDFGSLKTKRLNYLV